MSRQMPAALAMLLDLVGRGREFPDAHTRVCMHFGFDEADAEGLCEEYDEATSAATNAEDDGEPRDEPVDHHLASLDREDARGGRWWGPGEY